MMLFDVGRDARRDEMVDGATRGDERADLRGGNVRQRAVDHGQPADQARQPVGEGNRLGQRVAGSRGDRDRQSKPRSANDVTRPPAITK